MSNLHWTFDVVNSKADGETFVVNVLHLSLLIWCPDHDKRSEKERQEQLLKEMAEQKENIRNIYPNLPYLVLDKIMRYHREANGEIEPYKTVYGELNRVKQYSGIFYRKLKPSFIDNLKKVYKIDEKNDEIMRINYINTYRYHAY